MRLSLRFTCLVATLQLGVAASAASGWYALGDLDSVLAPVVDRLTRLNESQLATLVREAREGAEHMRVVLASISLLAGFVGAGLGYWLFESVRRSIRKVEQPETNLARLVQERTEALAARERALRLALDSTGDGIIGVTAKGTIVGDLSAAAAQWFGKAKVGQPLAKYLFPRDCDEEMAFQIALEQLLEGFLPWDVLVGQMPSRLEREDAVVELDYKRVAAGVGDVVMLIVARDVTERVQLEKAELEVREQQSLVAKLLADKQAFADFVYDTERLLAAIGSDQEPGSSRRDLRSLKAKVTMYGLGSIARLCEHIEHRLPDTDAVPNASEVAELGTLFVTKLRGIEDFLTGLNPHQIHDGDASEQRALIESLLTRRDRRELLEMVELWTWPRTSERLSRLRIQVEYVAKRLQKQVHVEVEHNDLRLPTDYLTRFWATLTHVVRNCVDHGIETADERVASGKSPTGLIRLRTWQTEDSFCLEVADDGAGIDTGALLRSARARGVNVDHKGALDLALIDGVSARTDITDLSGRGVGLSAVREACASEGGTSKWRPSRARAPASSFAFRVLSCEPADWPRRWSVVGRLCRSSRSIAEPGELRFGRRRTRRDSQPPLVPPAGGETRRKAGLLAAQRSSDPRRMRTVGIGSQEPLGSLGGRLLLARPPQDLDGKRLAFLRQSPLAELGLRGFEPCGSAVEIALP